MARLTLRPKTPLIAALVIGITTTAAAAQQAPSGPLTVAPSPSPVLLCAGGIGALVTRPTETTTTCVVPPDRVLIETGMNVQSVRNAEASYAYTSAPNAEIRIGTPLSNLEIDLFSPVLFRSSGETSTGDAGAGAKLLFRETTAWAWGASVNGTFPTGTNPALAPHGLGSVNAGTTSVNLNAEASLGSIFSVAATIGQQFDAAPIGSGGAQRYDSLVPSLEFAASLGRGATAFAEGWTQTNGEGPATGTHRWLDCGLQKSVRSIQFDLEYGISNAIAPGPTAQRIARRYAGFGISRLF